MSELTQDEKDLLMLMPPAGAKDGLSEKDIPKMLKELAHLKECAALWTLLRDGSVVMRVVKGSIRYFGAEKDPLR